MSLAINAAKSIYADAATSSSGPSAPSGSTDSSGTLATGNKDTFLKLLVAQLQNQSPLNPADGTAFVAQLAQFSQLEQSISMREDLDAVRQSLAQLQAAQKPEAGTTPPGVAQ
jgi:flagellar basal-body rod modification protein FlgD